MATQAEELIASPDDALALVIEDVQRVSASGGSTAMHTRTLEDGSAIIVSSSQGEPAELTTLDIPELSEGTVV